MKEYRVNATITGTVTVFVEAESVADAHRKAENGDWTESCELEWEVDEAIAAFDN